MTRAANIDQLAQLLDGEQPAAEADREAQTLSALADVLRASAVEAPAIRPEFRTALRQQVVAAAREQATSPPLLTRMRERVEKLKYSSRLAAGTGLAAMALSSGGVAGAAEHAQPGEILYGTKLAIEDARLALTFDDVARGERAVSYAGDRVGEAEIAVTRDHQTAAATALHGAHDRITEGSEDIIAEGARAPIARLGDSLAATSERVEALLPSLEGDAATAASGLLLTVERTLETISTTLDLPPLDAMPVAPGALIEVPGIDDGRPEMAPPATGDVPPAATPPSAATPADAPVAPAVEDVPDPAPDSVPQNDAAPLPDAVPVSPLDAVPVSPLDAVPDSPLDAVPASPLDDLPDVVPETLPDVVPETLPDVVPETLPDVVPEDLPQSLPEDLPQSLPGPTSLVPGLQEAIDGAPDALDDTIDDAVAPLADTLDDAISEVLGDHNLLDALPPADEEHSGVPDGESDRG